jgi:hypothetical protein
MNDWENVVVGDIDAARKHKENILQLVLKLSSAPIGTISAGSSAVR